MAIIMKITLPLTTKTNTMKERAEGAPAEMEVLGLLLRLRRLRKMDQKITSLDSQKLLRLLLLQLLHQPQPQPQSSTVRQLRHLSMLTRLLPGRLLLHI